MSKSRATCGPPKENPFFAFPCVNMSLNTRPEHSQATLQQWANSSSWKAPEVTLVTATVSTCPEKVLPLKSNVDPVLSATSYQNSRANLIYTKAKPVQTTKEVSLDGEWEESFQDLSSWCSQTMNRCTMDAREPNCVIDDELNTPEIGNQIGFDFASGASEEVPRTPELNLDNDWNISMTTDMDVLGSFDAWINSDSELIKVDDTPLDDAQALPFDNRDILNTQVIHDTFIEEQRQLEMSVIHEEIIDGSSDMNNSECVIESEDISESNSCFVVQQENIPIIVTLVAASELPASPDSCSSTYSPEKENMLLGQVNENSQNYTERNSMLPPEYINYDTKLSCSVKSGKRAFEETFDISQVAHDQFSPKPKIVKKESGEKAVLGLKLPPLNPSFFFENVGVSTPEVLGPLMDSNEEFNLLRYIEYVDSPDLKHMETVSPMTKRESSASNDIAPIVKTEQAVSNKQKSTSHTSKVKKSTTKSSRVTSRRKSSVKLETINISDISEFGFPSLQSPEPSTSTPITLKLRKKSGSQSKRSEDYKWEFENESDTEEVFKPARTKEIKQEPVSPTLKAIKRKLSSISELEDTLPSKQQRCSSSCSDNEFHSVGCSKYRELRDRNNEASRRSRMNRKYREVEMTEMADKLEKENQTLKIKADEMERLVKKMREALLNAVLKSKKEN